MTRLQKAITLRNVTKDDIPFMQTLYASVREAEFTATGLPSENIAQLLAHQFTAQYRHYLQHYNSDAFYIIEIDSEPIGRFFVDYGTADIRIVDIALLPRFRGQGIGSYLLGLVFVQAKNKKLPVTLHVEHHNPARRLYERLGFIARAGNDPVYLRMEWRPGKD